VHHQGGASDLCASSRRSFRFMCIIKEELQIYVHHLGGASDLRASSRRSLNIKNK
jgi:hypothetical protein